MSKRNIAAFICITAGVACTIIGIQGGEPLVVMQKAVMICLECIGIG